MPASAAALTVIDVNPSHGVLAAVSNGVMRKLEKS